MIIHGIESLGSSSWSGKSLMMQQAHDRPWLRIGLIVVAVAVQCASVPRVGAAVTREEVERAIREGVRFLKKSSETTAHGRMSKAKPGRAPPAW